MYNYIYKYRTSIVPEIKVKKRVRFKTETDCFIEQNISFFGLIYAMWKFEFDINQFIKKKTETKKEDWDGIY